MGTQSKASVIVPFSNIWIGWWRREKKKIPVTREGYGLTYICKGYAKKFPENFFGLSFSFLSFLLSSSIFYEILFYNFFICLCFLILKRSFFLFFWPRNRGDFHSTEKSKCLSSIFNNGALLRSGFGSWILTFFNLILRKLDLSSQKWNNYFKNIYWKDLMQLWAAMLMESLLQDLSSSLILKQWHRNLTLVMSHYIWNVLCSYHFKPNITWTVPLILHLMPKMIGDIAPLMCPSRGVTSFFELFIRRSMSDPKILMLIPMLIVLCTTVFRKVAAAPVTGPSIFSETMQGNFKHRCLFCHLDPEFPYIEYGNFFNTNV